MATKSLSIPATLLPEGQSTTPALKNISQGFTATITINRNGPLNQPWLNNITSESSLAIVIQSSPDGVTWNEEAATGPISGGPIVDFKTGQLMVSNDLSVGPLDPAATQVRAVCTVVGPSAIEVSGSIVTT